MILDLERTPPRVGVLRMLIELARHVGTSPGCPDAERARAVRRVHDYHDELDYLTGKAKRR